MKNRLLIFLFLFCLGMVSISAQSGREKSAPGELTLEITAHKGFAPAYLPIDKSAPGKWVWFSAFERVSGFINSADIPPVRAVKFICNPENEQTGVKVSVLTGRHLDNEIVVASYKLSGNERVLIKELSAFGVEPFEVGILRIAPSVALLPAVENKTSSLQVIGLEAQSSILPSCKLRLVNNSAKSVSAVAFEERAGGQMLSSSIKMNDQDKILIDAGEIFEKVLPVSLDDRQIREGDAAPSSSNVTLVITSVIFTDGSFEGDRLTAARVKAYALGRKVFLGQIISLIEGNRIKQQGAANKLAEDALSLKINIDEQEFSRLIQTFPGLTDREKSTLHFGAEAALSKLKKEFLTELETRLQKNDSVDQWLISIKEDYQNWIARIN